MADFAAYLFDMDGLLLDTERLFMQPFLEMSDELGLPLDQAREFYLALIGTSAAVTSQRLPGYLPSHVAPQDFEAEWRGRYQDLIQHGIPMRPGVTQVLNDLKGQGARMAVVTSTQGEMARAKLAQTGILEVFELVKAGDEVSANKPHPAPYQEAAAALGVSPHDCAAFEDSDTGITAAVAAGCHAVQIPDLRPEGKPLPDLGQLVAPTLPEAVALVHESARIAAR